GNSETGPVGRKRKTYVTVPFKGFKPEYQVVWKSAQCAITVNWFGAKPSNTGCQTGKWFMSPDGLCNWVNLSRAKFRSGRECRLAGLPGW
ncbi:hypothetical protein E4U53_004120, partial [Claviceps sorghi]